MDSQINVTIDLIVTQSTIKAQHSKNIIHRIQDCQSKSYFLINWCNIVSVQQSPKQIKNFRHNKTQLSEAAKLYGQTQPDKQKLY